jgi:hypothetical protein
MIRPPCGVCAFITRNAARAPKALSELPGPLKRLHFSTSNDAGPASGAQRKADSLADTAAAPGDYRMLFDMKWHSLADSQ